jgi:glycosyltransferase involved in cell wall biosynthesis
VRNVQRLDERIMYIPQSNPFVTKLAAVATEVVRNKRCDLIFAYYMEPYGMAAHLASRWTSIPYMLKHAGSDYGRLLKQTDLRTAYQEILRGADCVWTGLGAEPLMAIGVNPEKVFNTRAFTLPDIFSPAAEPMDINSVLRELPSDGPFGLASQRIDPGLPTIGIYGKVGEAKGSFDLIQALAGLRREGLRFNFAAMTQGKTMARFVAEIKAGGLGDCSVLIPFLPHWRVPGFIRTCSAVCFLERDFPITFHSPTVPKEVLACGTCLILSGEIADKQVYSLRSRLIDGESLLLVRDPKVQSDLADKLRFVIQHPDKARAIGMSGSKQLGEAGMRPQQPGSDTPEMSSLLQRLADIVAPPDSRVPIGHDDAAELRKTRLAGRLPWTKRLLGAEWDRVADAYVKTQQESNAFLDAKQFCEFADVMLSPPASNGTPAYIRDVLKYERAHNSLYIPQQPTGRPPARNRRRIGFAAVELEPAAANASQEGPKIRLRQLPKKELLSIRPRISEAVRIESFEYDLLKFRRLRGPDLRRQVSPERTFILFKPELNFVNLELQISEASRAFIGRCDGEKSVEEILRAVFKDGQPEGIDPDDMIEQIRHLMHQCVQLGILQVDVRRRVEETEHAVAGA